MERQNTEHISVMTNEILEYLRIKPDGFYVDATLGLGGHAQRILERLEPAGRVIGFDQDRDALVKARARLENFGQRFEGVHSNFRFLSRELTARHRDTVDGVVFDLGVSSLQLNTSVRGFSFQADGPLDMRMDVTSPRRASDIVAEFSEEELAKIICLYGEERFARRIAQRIVQERKLRPILTTADLSRIVCRAIPAGHKWQRLHPATRTFQALRIEVNEELKSLTEGLEQALSALNPGGRICVIAFHSLEDRLVKVMFKDRALSGNFELPFKRPLRPSPQEENDNPRARSARLRVIEKRECP